MSSRIVVDCSPFYTRCAVIVEGQTHEIHIMPTGSESIEGNIFVGRIETISKGIDAAFVSIGQKNNAFLYIDEKTDAGKYKCGQTVIVQALRDASKGKGVYITTNISFAGNYVVVFPDGENDNDKPLNEIRIGVSSKIVDRAERKRLIDLVRPFANKNISIVLRTAAANKTDEIIKDLQLVLKKMELALKRASIAMPPSLIYEERHFLEKIVRDTICYDAEEIVINDEDELQKLEPLAESLGIKLTLHNEGTDKRNLPLIFEHYGVEPKIREALKRKIHLKTGGFLIIDETEALVAIDVNTGKSKRREKTGETIFCSNLEAAVEIPRQLRLRNLSGIIVVDFIDMKSEEKKTEILETLKKECAKDRNKTIVVGFTELGLALITRKKTREPISRVLLASCGEAKSDVGGYLNGRIDGCVDVRSDKKGAGCVGCVGGKRHTERFSAFNIYCKMKKAILNSGQKKLEVCSEEHIIRLLEEPAAKLAKKHGVEIDLMVKK